MPSWAAALLVGALAACARALPERMGLRLFSGVGSIAFRSDRAGRSRAIENLARAFPDGDPMIVAAMARGSFIALARNARDALRLRNLARDEILDLCAMDGEEHLWEACHAGKGVIALTGRIGCWELLPVYLWCKGYRVNVMSDDARAREINGVVVSSKGRDGVAVLSGGGPSAEALAALGRGEIVGMLFDRDAGAAWSAVPFFGAPACASREAAALAVRAGAAIIPMAIHMQPEGRHRITVLPALEQPETGASELERVDAYTRRSALAVEGLIRMYPQQWAWSSDLWRGKERVDCTGSSSEPSIGAAGSRT